MDFQYTSAAQQIVFGAGALERLSAHLDALGVRRALLCSSASYRRNGTISRLQRALGERLPVVFEGVQPHVPDTAVGMALDRARVVQVDGIIGLGGGSAVGTAKAVAAALMDERSEQPAGAGTSSVPVIAVPTTYAGSEMTAIYGTTRTAEGRKATTTDARVLPRLVVYDVTLTLDLPADLTAATGINGLAHCIEGVYSITRNPLSTVAALAGIDHIRRALPRCVENGRDLQARETMLVGGYLAGTTIAHTTLALHHGLCHVLGGTAGVPHGVANSIMLPHVMRFNQLACAAELAAVARALGCHAAGLLDEEAAAVAVEEVGSLIHQLGLPRRLRDAGVALSDLPHLAAVALTSAAVQANPRPVSVDDVEALLRGAW